MWEILHNPDHHTKLLAARHVHAINLVESYHQYGKFNAMKTTIDKAGRVVIPAEIRREALLEPGTEIRIVYEAGVVRIERDVPPPKVEREGRFLRVRPTTDDAPALDIPGLVRDERERWPF